MTATRPSDGAPGTPVSDAAAAAKAATEHLLGLQSPEGWWKGELETNVTMDAEDLMLRHFLGVLDPTQAEAAARMWSASGRSPARRRAT